MPRRHARAHRHLAPGTPCVATPGIVRNGRVARADQTIPPASSARPSHRSPCGGRRTSIGVRVKRPSRLVLVTSSLTVVGLLVGGTAYAFTSRDTETYAGCVNNRTGALRMLVDQSRGGGCYTKGGPWQETPISWSRNAGPPGPAGPAAPAGPAGPGGNGEGASLTSLDELAGLPCNTDGPDAGVVAIRISPPDQGSLIQMICKTDATVDWPPHPPTTQTPQPPTQTTRPQPTQMPPGAAPTELPPGA
jgi:hypothetical protein